MPKACWTRSCPPVRRTDKDEGSAPDPRRGRFPATAMAMVRGTVRRLPPRPVPAWPQFSASTALKPALRASIPPTNLESDHYE